MNIEDLYPYVLPSVRGCPHITALDAIQAAAAEFCRRTLIWRQTLPAVASVLAPITFTAPLVAATIGTLSSPFGGSTRSDYILTFSDGTTQMVTLNNGSTAVSWPQEITATASAIYSQIAYAIPTVTDAVVCKLLKFTVDGVKRTVATPEVGEDLTLYRFQEDAAWLTDSATFQVTPPPRVAGTQYGLTVAWQPTLSAMTLPDWIGTNHAEDIAFGALWRLEGMNGRQWSNKADSQSNKESFEDRIKTVAAKSAKGFGNGRVRAKARFF